MKNIFLLLLLANLLVLVWEHWVVGPGRDLNVEPLESETPALVYLNPRTPAPDNAGTGAAVDTMQATLTSRCVRVGPFADETSADLAQVRVAGRVRSVRTRAISGDIWVGHWVQIRNLTARSEARLVLERLKANGIGDAYIVPTEEAYKISMGVFRDRRGADSIARRARRLGYDVDISDRFRPGTSHWLEMELGSGEQPDLGSLQSEVGRILRAEQYECGSADTQGPDLPVDEAGPDDT